MLQKAEEKQIVEYSVVEADIAQMKSVYMDLAITDLEDTEQFKQVNDARLIVKGKRCAVENERKSLKKEALEWGRKVDGRANEIFALIKPIESHLQAEEQKVLDEQERINAEADAKEKAMLKKRFDDLYAVGYTEEPIALAVMTDDEFQCLLDDKTFAFNEAQKEKAEAEAKEKKRLADEEAARKAEDERLAKQKVEQEAEAARLTDIQADLDKKAKSIQDEKDRIVREEQAKIDAENARIKAAEDAKAKAEQDAKDAEERELAAKEAEDRRVALLPDIEKIKYWIELVEAQIDDFPHEILSNDRAMAFVQEAVEEFEKALEEVQRMLKEVEKL